MPAKPQRTTFGGDTRAWKLFNELPWTHENRLAIARAFLDDEGDVPQETVYSFMVEAHDSAESLEIQRTMMQLREEHFARIGKPLPAYDLKLR